MRIEPPPSLLRGLYGIKPARGRVSPAPWGGLEGFSTSGPLTRTVLDAAALLDVMAGYETGDPWWAPPPERGGLLGRGDAGSIDRRVDRRRRRHRYSQPPRIDPDLVGEGPPGGAAQYGSPVS